MGGLPRDRGVVRVGGRRELRRRSGAVGEGCRLLLRGGWAAGLGGLSLKPSHSRPRENVGLSRDRAVIGLVDDRGHGGVRRGARKLVG